MTRYNDIIDPLEEAAERDGRPWWQRKVVWVPAVVLTLLWVIGTVTEDPVEAGTAGGACPVNVTVNS